jgi:CRISPR system Cascade subunit CasE
MVYLSRLFLNPRSRQVQAELRDSYQMHRTLSKAFSDDREEYRQARCLFRVDESPGEPHLCLLVQSRLKPNWDQWMVAERYLIALPTTKEFEPNLHPGQLLAFRLRANPTVRREGKRLGLYRDEERLSWLARKGEMHGFRPCQVVVRKEDRLQSRSAAGHEATLNAVRFDGTLRVTEPGKCIEALEGGIGSGKGFGFGLLSLARA